MIAEFDSVTQANIYLGAGHHEAIASWKAALRIADLIAGEVIVTDAQVLDGVFFLLLGPSGIVKALGRDDDDAVPLTISTESDSLAKALIAMRNRGNFIWSSSRAIHDSHRLEELQAEWLQAERDGQLKTVPVDRPLDLPATLAASLPISSRLGVSADIDHQLRNCERRSMAYRTIDSAYANAAETAVALRAWVNRGYARAQAIQHDADWIEVGSSSACATSLEGATGGSTTKDARFVISGSLMDELSSMPASLYSIIRQRSTASRREWAEHRNVRALRTLALVASETVSVAPAWINTSVRTVAAAMLVALFAVLALVGEVMSNIGWLLGVTIIVIFLKELPWREISLLLMQYRPARLRGVVNVEARAS